MCCHMAQYPQPNGADRSGVLEEVTLGVDNTTPYEVCRAACAAQASLQLSDCNLTVCFQSCQDGTSPYFGAPVGRVVTNIARASFKLHGRTYHVTANKTQHHFMEELMAQALESR